jgi:uncharacterized protein (TIGR04255 family)
MNKLHPDSIVDVVFEARFEHDDDPDLIIGKIRDKISSVKNAKPERLPSTTDLPHSIRIQHESLKYLPSFRFRPQGKFCSVRIGGNSISIAVTGQGNYPGGDILIAEIAEVFEEFLNALSNSIQITRLGLRYTNLLTEEDHDISGIDCLAIEIKCGNERVVDDLLLTYSKNCSTQHRLLIRVAAPQFVKSKESIDQKFTALVDIDVSTPEQALVETVEDIKAWLFEARKHKNKAYGDIMGAENIVRLTKEPV